VLADGGTPVVLALAPHSVVLIAKHRSRQVWINAIKTQKPGVVKGFSFIKHGVKKKQSV
jgi:hypothetical protein